VSVVPNVPGWGNRKTVVSRKTPCQPCAENCAGFQKRCCDGEGCRPCQTVGSFCRPPLLCPGFELRVKVDSLPKGSGVLRWEQPAGRWRRTVCRRRPFPPAPPVGSLAGRLPAYTRASTHWVRHPLAPAGRRCRGSTDLLPIVPGASGGCRSGKRALLKALEGRSMTSSSSGRSRADVRIRPLAYMATDK